MMLAAVYVAHGVSIRTTTALLGTVAGIVLTVLLALWGTDAAHLTGDVDETPACWPPARISICRRC